MLASGSCFRLYSPHAIVQLLNCDRQAESDNPWPTNLEVFGLIVTSSARCFRLGIIVAMAAVGRSLGRKSLLFPPLASHSRPLSRLSIVYGSKLIAFPAI